MRYTLLAAQGLINLSFKIYAIYILDFQANYHSDACDMDASTATPNMTEASVLLTTVATAATSADNSTQVFDEISPCLRESSLLYLLLTFGTVWLALSLFNFTKT